MQYDKAVTKNKKEKQCKRKKVVAVGTGDPREGLAITPWPDLYSDEKWQCLSTHTTLLLSFVFGCWVPALPSVLENCLSPFQTTSQESKTKQETGRCTRCGKML